LAFIFDGLSGCGFSHLYAIAFYSLPTGPNFGVHLIPHEKFAANPRIVADRPQTFGNFAHMMCSMPAKDRTLTTFGLNVARLRAAKGFSQEKLAEKADIDRTYLRVLS